MTITERNQKLYELRQELATKQNEIAWIKQNIWLINEMYDREHTSEISGKSKTPTLDHFSRDITQMAKKGKLDPVIGRENEIERVAQILTRRKKNNPVLIGEPCTLKIWF